MWGQGLRCPQGVPELTQSKGPHRSFKPINPEDLDSFRSAELRFKLMLRVAKEHLIILVMPPSLFFFQRAHSHSFSFLSEIQVALLFNLFHIMICSGVTSLSHTKLREAFCAHPAPSVPGVPLQLCRFIVCSHASR